MRDDVVKMVAVEDMYYLPRPYNYPQFTNVFSLALDDYSLQSKTLTLEGQPTLYMSEDTLVLASTRWINDQEIMMEEAYDVLSPYLSDRDKDLIRKIKGIDGAVLSRAEKDQKIMQVLPGR